MGEDSGEKTEEPTPHKLREARKKGQIAKSKDLTAALLLLASFYTLKASGDFMWQKMTEVTFMSFNFFASDFSVSVAGYLLKNVLTIFLAAMAPLFAVNMLVAILLEALQTGFLISFEALEPSFDKLNPIEGMKKFFSLKQYVELIKSVLKMAIVILIIYYAIKNELLMILISQQMQPYQVMAFTGTIVMRVIIRVGLFYFLIGILDYFYQRYEYIKGLKMSKKEIKDEYKRMEGDPMVKQRQRDAQRQMSQGRQMGAVPDADVVVTNPIHVAIAIQYSPNKMRAPKVVAKGRRLVAKEIKRLAELHQIPIVENPPLARSLYDVANVGNFVPPMFYKAVAEILAFVYNLKKKKKNRF